MKYKDILSPLIIASILSNEVPTENEKLCGLHTLIHEKVILPSSLAPSALISIIIWNSPFWRHEYVTSRTIDGPSASTCITFSVISWPITTTAGSNASCVAVKKKLKKLLLY